MLARTQRTEVLIASILPTTAILLVGVVGIEHMQGLDIRFLLVVLFASAAVFGLEYTLLTFMQRTIGKQVDDLLLVCQDYLSGNRQRRPDVSGIQPLSPLVYALYKVLDAASQHTTSQADTLSHPGRKPAQSSQLEAQIQKLIHEIMPAVQGDLRGRAEIAQGNIGILANLCNAFIDEIVELILWIRYSSSQIKNATQSLVNGSVELAQTAEAQMLRFSQTAQKAETLTSDLEDFYGTLQLNAEIVQKLQMDMRQYEAGAPFNKDDVLQRLAADTKRQEELLEKVLSSAQSNVMLAKGLISAFHSFARSISASSVDVFQAAEYLKSISALAEQWYATVTAFQLPISIEKKVTQVPTKTVAPPQSSMKR